MFTISSFTENNSTSSNLSVYTHQKDDFPSTQNQTNTLRGIVTKDVVAGVENVINIGILPAVVAIGVITNVINMAVFLQQGLADRVNICLFSLSLADLGYLVFMMAGKSHSVLSLIGPLLGQYWKAKALGTVVGTHWGLMNVSIILTMIISLDRCVCVLLPLRARLFIRPRAMVAIIVCVFVVILGFYGVFNLKFIAIARTNPSSGNRTLGYMSGLSPFYLRNRALIDATYTLGIIIPTMSMIVVIITTTTTAIQLHLSLSWRKQSAQQTIRDRQEMALTKMLVAICCVYVVCITPKAFMPLVQQRWPELRPSGRYSNMYFMLNALMHVLQVTNSSVNFFFYWALGSRYREALQTLCWCCSPKKGRTVIPDQLPYCRSKKEIKLQH